MSDKKGSFTFHNLPTGQQLKILVSVAAYNSYRKLFMLGKTENMDFGTIKVSSKQLREVEIKGERPPVVIRADTIEFAAEAFKVRPNAVVEDLLKKLPGVEVSADGFVTVNGRSVSKILVDGHEFFTNDPRIATKNLDADMIDKVQVYDDRENDPNHLAPDPTVNKIINLKFKKQYKKSIFGKFFAGAGTEGRYETGGLVNMFRDTLQVSLLGANNNLSSTGFSYTDLYTSGGANRGGSDAISRAGLSSFGAAANGIQKIFSGGANINTDYGKKVKINLAYFYTRTVNTFNSITDKQQLLNDTTFNTDATNNRVRVTTQHTLSSLIKLQPTDRTQINYNPAVTFSDNQTSSSGIASSFNNFIPLVSQSNSTDNIAGNNTRFQQSFSYNHQFRLGESVTITHSLQVNPNYSTDYSISNLTSFTTGLTSYSLNRFNNNNSKSTDANIGVSYNYQISNKLITTLGITGDYNHQVNNTLSYDFDAATGLYDLFLQEVSSSLTRNQSTQTINPAIRYIFKQFYSLSASLNTQLLQVNNQFDRNAPDINQQFAFFLPSINLSIKSFNVGYSKSEGIPNIGDMIPYTVIVSPIYNVTGNPNLKPSTRNNFNLGYSVYNTKSLFNINFNGNASFEENTVVRVRTLNDVGLETSTPVNMSGVNNFRLSTGLTKRFKKQNDITFSERTDLSVGRNHGFFELNGQDGYQNAYSVNVNQHVSFNWKDIVDIDEMYTLNDYVTTYSGVNYANVNNISHVADTHFIFYWSQSTSVEGTYTFTYRDNVSPGFQKNTNLLNLNIAHTLLNNKGQIKFTCYDILNQNINAIRIINENTITDTQSQILKRYFLLTLQYKFSKSLTKK